jgi:hypothetical protein
MRILTELAGGLAIAGALALAAPSAQAENWCGFQQKAHSRVRCGYSSLQECKQALADKKDGDKGVICVPDSASG